MQQFTNNRKEIRISTFSPQQTPDIYKFQRNVTNKKSWDGHKSIRDMKMFLLILSQLVWAEEANNDNINYNALRWRDYWVLCRILYKPPLPPLRGKLINRKIELLSHQHVWLTRGLQHSGVGHSLGHDVPPNSVNLGKSINRTFKNC